jgi:hypothetical protein
MVSHAMEHTLRLYILGFGWLLLFIATLGAAISLGLTLSLIWIGFEPLPTQVWVVILVLGCVGTAMYGFGRRLLHQTDLGSEHVSRVAAGLLRQAGGTSLAVGAIIFLILVFFPYGPSPFQFASPLIGIGAVVFYAGTMMMLATRP